MKDLTPSTVALITLTIDYDTLCKEWYTNETKNWEQIMHYWTYTNYCPCRLSTVECDMFWMLDWPTYLNSSRLCYYERMPLLQSTQYCCYDKQSGDLRSTTDGTAGSTYYYHPRYAAEHSASDMAPRDWCCKKSNNCNLYLAVRPMDKCVYYKPPVVVWVFGDPHFVTSDGHQFTYNGQGEFYLIKSKDGIFTMQVRLLRPGTTNGVEPKGTAIAAIAAKNHDASRLHVEVNRQTNELLIVVGDESYTKWFKDAADNDYTYVGNVALSKVSGNSAMFSFASGVTLKVLKLDGYLAMQAAVGSKLMMNNTEGLLGVYNDNREDDLMAPDGSTLDIHSATESDVYHKFGEQWRVEKSDESLFHYSDGTDFSTYQKDDSYVPTFTADALAGLTDAERAQLKAVCGTNQQCIYDFAVTGSEEFANATLTSAELNRRLMAGLGADSGPCLAQPCQNDGICTNVGESYQCECIDGFQGDQCEIEPTAPEPTVPEPTNTDPTTGTAKSTTTYPASTRPTLYPYGDDQGDKKLKCQWRTIGVSKPIWFSPVNLFGMTTNRLVIFSKGYVSIQMRYTRRTSIEFNKILESMKAKHKTTAFKVGFGIFAPLFTDSDCSSGAIYYQVYNKKKPASDATEQAKMDAVLERVKQDVEKYSGLSVTPTWVLVVTWDRLLPRHNYDASRDQPNSFQLVFASDPATKSSYLLYLYSQTGWDHTLQQRPSTVGYYVTHRGKSWKQPMWQSNTQSAFRLAELSGNTGEKGVYFFTLNDRSLDENKCLTWYAAEKSKLDDIKKRWKKALACPCDLSLAVTDGRWILDWLTFVSNSASHALCYYERNPSSESTQYCCYNEMGALITAQDGSGGQMFLYHPRHVAEHRARDIQPKQWCCKESKNCDKFYAVRPMSNCVGYVTPTHGWLFGDPHIRSADGFRYTFNGLGEYTLLQTSEVILQGRTSRARRQDGQPTNATVFSAFAAENEGSGRVHVALNDSRDGLVIYVGDNELTEWFTSANESAETEILEVSMQKLHTNQVAISFRSGLTLGIEVKVQQLNIGVSIPANFKNKTKGLLGIYNDDVTDDLTPPSGKRLSTNTSSERDIYYNFGQLWLVQSGKSLFINATKKETLADFKPSFSEDVLKALSKVERSKADILCGSNKQCLLDYAVTENIEFAKATLTANKNYEEIAENLANIRPTLKLSETTLKVTTRILAKLKVEASDPDSDNVTIRLLSTLPAGAFFDSGTGMYTWTPQSAAPVRISFVAVDGRHGMSLTVNVMVNLCDCSEHGKCYFDGDYPPEPDLFRVVACVCSEGWAGARCDQDEDGCADSPCAVGADCTDLSPAEATNNTRGYRCSNCPDGYRLDDGICVDVDECSEDNTTCQHLCYNRIPGFMCVCREGFSLAPDGRSCYDTLGEDNFTVSTTAESISPSNVPDTLGENDMPVSKSDLSRTLFIVFGCTFAVIIIALIAALVVFLLRTRRSHRSPFVTETRSVSDVTSYDRPLSSKSRLWFDEGGSTRSLRRGSDLTSYEQRRAEVIKHAMAKEPAVDWNMVHKFARRNGQAANNPNEGFRE